MALFSKPLSKKNAPSSADANARSGKRGAVPGAGSDAEARKRLPESSIGGITITGFGVVDWSPTRRQIEVTQGQAGMCAVLENAVLLYASGHADQALPLLARGVQEDEETKRSPLAWLALFDLLQRAGNRAAFEQLALLYVVRFERSAPSWDERSKPPAVQRAATAGGYIAITGKLTAASGAHFESLKRAIVRNDSQARFDLAAVTEFDDGGARALAEVLGEARRRQYPLRVQRAERLQRALEGAVARGRESGEGAWLLWLELLQWQSDRANFDDWAVQYAITFEVSPPSWEPPLMPQTEPEQPSESASAAEAESLAGGGEMLAMSGVLVGSHAPEIAQLAEFAQQRDIVPIDMSGVDRIDFVCAGAMLNAINNVEKQRKVVEIFGVTPIILAILLLIGLTPGHFVKKAP
jgi:ABC-type transporter Mla MlaB component